MRPDPTSSRTTIAGARSFLFVPGDRPDRFAKAAASTADVVILDLEDAVAPANKDAARIAVADWLRAGNQCLVRINSMDTHWCENDLGLLGLAGLIGIMVPKAEACASFTRIAAMLPTVALIESAEGVATVNGVARTPGVERLAYGTIDLALDLDIASPETLASIGTSLVVASRRYNLAAPIDGVTLSLKDGALIEGAMRDARDRGFGAKLCVHPEQTTPVRRAFLPTIDEVEKARRIVAADREARGAAVALDGEMIDRPVVAKAYRTLADASAAAAA